ncbi:DUF4241 domain-containing protein [Microbispora sp. ZYX-F-249]|uniref:DUF4241 domain-containing protein n=1 Tax=Microbispora maris TaxID=3144104 RepID=A0ABV0AFM2_9ACTN
MRKAAAGHLSEQVAAERDGRGEQYAVLVSAGRPWMMLEVAWGHGHWAVWLFDEQGRRTVKYDHRVLADDQIFLRHTCEWRYDSAEQAEFDARAWTRSRTFDPDGRCREILEPKGDRGGSRHTWPKADPGRLWFPMPVFGEWAFAHRYLSGLSPDAAVRVTGAPDAPERVTSPWRPPAPMRPRWLDRMFRQGERFALPRMGEVVMDVQPGPSLVMPTGRLVAADPGCVEDDTEAFTAAVPPGTYEVSLAVAAFVDDPEHRRVAGVKVVIADRQPVTWELALEPGQDPRLLGDGEFYGFGVDTGMGCLFDASAARALAAAGEDDDEFDRICDLVHEHVWAGIDVGPGANCVAFLSGWGDGAYPVWAGRDADGDVVCFVADMIILNDAAV